MKRYVVSMNTDILYGKGKKKAHLIYGLFHIILGVGLMIGFTFVRFSPFLIIGFALYTALGIYILSRFFNLQKTFIHIDEDQINYNNIHEKPLNLNWSDILSIVIYPQKIHFYTSKNQETIHITIFGFQEIRKIKKHIIKIAQERGIDYIMISPNNPERYLA